MEGNAGPAWSFENLTPFTRLGVPREPSLPRPEPAYANRRESPHYRARTPDAAMRGRYSASREPTAQPNDRPTSAGAANPSIGEHFPYTERSAQNMEYGQLPRFEGDGFDMRRPVGWQNRAEGQGRAEDRHLVEISDGEDDEPIVVDEDGDDIAAYNVQSEEGHESEDIVDLTEDDAPAYNWQSRVAQPAQDARRPRSQPPVARRLPNNDAARLPRGMAGIINLDNGDEAWTVDDEPVVLEPSSPDIQFVSARRLDQPNRAIPLPRRNDSDGDDVQFVQERPLTEEERRARQRAQQHAELDRVIAVLGEHRRDHFGFAHLRGEIDRANAHIDQVRQNMGGPQPPPRTRRGGHIRVGVAGGVGGMFVMPNLNFGVVGFDLGYGGGHQAEPPPATYEAPPPAPEGFTRSPEENDVLVCPNCDSELCKGDDDIKKQVWIAKKCGHVSSVHCCTSTSKRSNTHNRSTAASAQQTVFLKRAPRAKRRRPRPRPDPSKSALWKAAARESPAQRLCFRSSFRRLLSHMLDTFTSRSQGASAMVCC